MAIGTEIVVPVTYKTKVDDSAIDSTFSKQTEQYPLALPPPQMGEHGAENLQSLNETITNNTDSFKGNTAIMKEFGDIMPEIIKQLRQMNSVVAQTTTNLPAIGRLKTTEEQRKDRRAEYDRQNFLNVFNTGSGALQSLSGGNIGGAGIGLVSGASNAVSNYSKMADMDGLAGLSKGLLVGGTVLAAAAAVFKGGKALSDAYKDAMPSIFNTGKAFGTTDSDESLRLYKTINKYSNGTNLDNSEFNSLVQSLRKQGIGNEYSSPTSQAIATSQIAATTAKWAYATGGDANQYAQLAGIMSRYGGSKNVAEDFNYLVSAGKASGLNDTQIPEFLSGIQKVMEDGIAKGFTRSSKEVADTMLMFSKMSGGNAFWQSEKGAQMLGQMNSGISSATSLSKTEDILTYQAFKSVYNDEEKIKAALGYGTENSTYIEGGGYANMMQLIEKGVTPENFGALMTYAKNASGGSDIRESEILKNMFGLNYNGVGRLQNLNWQSMSPEELSKQIREITTAPENQNNETRWKNDLNRVAEALESGGAKIFASVTLPGMDAISTNVKKITDYLVKDEKGKNGNKSAISENNPNEEYRMKNGGTSSAYDLAKSEAEERAQKLPQYKQDLLRSSTSKNNFDAGPNGEGFNKRIDFIENFDLSKQRWDSEVVEPADYNDLGFFEKGIYKLASPLQRQKMLFEKGYKIKQPFSDDTSITDVVADVSGQKIQSLLSKGTVSQDSFMAAIADSAEIQNKLKEYVKSGWIEKDEQTELAGILQKIFDTLERGITVNKNH